MDSKTETVSDIAMIAAFMGHDYLYSHTKQNIKPIEFIPYDKSWDWLMPVVEKIENIIDIKVHETIQVNSTLDDPKGWRSWDYYRIELSTDIKSVYGKAVEFIHFYNSQSSDTINEVFQLRQQLKEQEEAIVGLLNIIDKLYPYPTLNLNEDRIKAIIERARKLIKG